MSQATQAFTQSLRLIDPINQERIKQQKRILWPDYEALTLIHSFEEASIKQQADLDLSNLFIYCAIEQKFLVKKTNKKDYLQLSQCYDPEFTHMAVFMCKNRSYASGQDCLTNEKQSKSQSIDNQRKKSLQRIYNSAKIETQPQQVYVILSRRAIAIDEVIKTNHKVCISVVPLSREKHLWGGQLNFEQFEPSSFNDSKKEDNSLFKTGGETFGFNITSKSSNLQGSIRRTNGIIDKRQLRFSNYYNSKREETKQEERKQPQPKECTNIVKITPQHIRTHKQFLYIEIDLNTQSEIPPKPDQYNFVSLDIFGRHLKPKYGGKYDDQSSEESQNEGLDGHKRLKRLIKEQIFLVYSMPFMVFSSYLESQLIYEENQDLREIGFRGSCSMFSAMKKLQLKSAHKQDVQNQREENGKSEQGPIQLGKKQKFTDQGMPMEAAHGLLSPIEKIPKQQTNNSGKDHENGPGQYEVIELGPQPEKQVNLQKERETTIESMRIEAIRYLVLRIKQDLKEQLCSHPSNDIYFPVHKQGSCQPDRLSIAFGLLHMINPDIQKLATKVEVESYRIKDREEQQDVEIDKCNRKSRQSMYMGGDSKNRVELQHINYKEIDVFLTRSVYKQLSVEKLAILLETLKKLAEVREEEIENQKQWTGMLDNILGFASVEELHSFFNLINDIGDRSERIPQEGKEPIIDLLKCLVWMDMMCVIQKMTSAQIQLIEHIKGQTSDLIIQSLKFNQFYSKQTSTDLAQSQRQLTSKQQNIISLIKDYHRQSTIFKSIGNFPIQLFFYFFQEQLNESIGFWYFATLQTISPNSQQFLRMIKTLENLFGQFFLINSQSIFAGHPRLLNQFMTRLEETLQECKNNPDDVEIDRSPEQTVTLTNHYESYNQTEKSRTPLHLVKLLKYCLNYTMENLPHIPANIFLADPLQSFDDEEQAQNDAKSKANSYSQFQPNRLQKLQRFIRRYFVRGHNNFHRESSAVNQLDNDSEFMNLVTDLLEIYIKVTNYEGMIVGSQRMRQVKNVIELIRNECFGMDSDLIFGKIRPQKASYAEIRDLVVFPRTNTDDRSDKALQAKINNLKSKPSYRCFNASFLIQLQYPNQHNSSKSSYKNSSPKQITLHNTKQFPLSDNSFDSQNYDFILKIQQRNSLQPLNSKNLNSFDIQMIFARTKAIESLKNCADDSYEISFLNSQLGLKQSHNNRTAKRTIFACFQVIVRVSIVLRNDLKQQRSGNDDFQTVTFHSANLLIFDNFKTSSIGTNIIALSAGQKDNELILKRSSLSNIHKVSIQIHSCKLPVLEHSLSFVNLRLNKYIKSLPQNPNPKPKSTRKTIGGRFTEHLSKRNESLLIEQNIGVGNSKNIHERSNQLLISTLYHLPQQLLYHLLSADKCYVQDDQKLLKFVDEFYNKNPSVYTDYVLYLAIRPTFLRLSTILKHFFANKSKYQDSEILTSFIKLKMSSLSTCTQLGRVSKIFSFIPRISSMRPLKNAKDTMEQRELLVKYAKEYSKRQSLQKSQNQTVFKGINIFGKKTIPLESKSKEKEEEKEIEI